MTDRTLIQQYAKGRQQSAFVELVRRHGGMVYATARRLAPGDADDVSQAVFLLLSQKAAGLVEHCNLAGWLYEAARHYAANVNRERQRHAAKLRAAGEAYMATSTSEPSTETPLLEHLDDGMSRLPLAIKQVLLLRYMQGLSVDETAGQLGLTSAAVMKRSTRGLSKLRDFFQRQGYVTSAEGLAVCMVTQVTVPAPAQVAGWSSPTAAPPLTSVPLGIGKAALVGAASILVVVGAILVLNAMQNAGAPVGGAPAAAAPADPLSLMMNREPADDDAAALYLRAAKLINDNYAAGITAPAASNITSRGYPPFADDWTKMETTDFAANAPARALAHRARTLTQAHWPPLKSPSPTSYLNLVRGVSNELADAMLFESGRQHPQAAVETFYDQWHLSDLLQKSPEPTLVVALVSIGIRASSLSRLEIVVAHAPLSNDVRNANALPISVARKLLVELSNHDTAVSAMNIAVRGEHLQDHPAQAVVVDRLVETAKRLDADRELAAMSLACHLYLFDNGHWPASVDDLKRELPALPIDPFGDGKQTLGYTLIKHGLPDGSDRPLVFSRAHVQDGLFFRVDRPAYSYYNDLYVDDTGRTPLPADQQKSGGQFRDVAGWAPAGNGITKPTTRPIP